MLHFSAWKKSRCWLLAVLLSALYACGGGGESSDPDQGGGLSGGELSKPSYEQAYRFLRQASFGPTEQDLDLVMTRGFSSWLDAQLSMRSAYDSSRDRHKTHLERMIEIATALEPRANWYPQNNSNDSGSDIFNGAASGFADSYQMSAWFENALDGPDQLRQKMAYALSQILVTSAGDPQLERNAEALAHYYDILARHALGNFRDLLGDVAKSPAMGIYLSHQGNEKASADGLTLPDENFARELMQLFSVGLYHLNLDGSPRRDGSGQLIPTYTQTDIEEMSKVMTGWDLRYNNRYGRNNGSYVHPMEFNPDHHQLESKHIMGTTISDDGAGGDLEQALDLLFEHDTTGPFISKQLIQRLVTSNPTPQYIARVAAVFNDNGSGVRGDLAAVARAILLDQEARNTTSASQQGFGKADEHLLAFTRLLRSFNVQPLDGWQINSDNGRVPVNGVYFFNGIQSLLGQGPLRARSVFNFYDPDYVPQDSYYQGSDPQKVLPEMQLRSANNIAYLFELTRLNRYFLERNEIERSKGSLQAYVTERNGKRSGGGNWNGSRALALVDYSRALKAFELGMEGDSNGDYSQIDVTDEDEAGFTPKQRGLVALLDELETILLGDQALPIEQRDELIDYLDQGSFFNVRNNATAEAIRVVAGAVQYLFISTANMAQQ